uniref:Uncharacterized protein n=1 Tax=Rhizophora mucronata TaxID=61149 RepID=A0A2P2JXY8_RHIMU
MKKRKIISLYWLRLGSDKSQM